MVVCNRLKCLYINYFELPLGIILDFKYETNRHFALSYFDWKFKKATKKKRNCCEAIPFNFSNTNLAIQTEESNWLTVILYLIPGLVSQYLIFR